MLNLDSYPSIEGSKAMSLLEPRLNELRAGFGGYGLNLPASPLLPLWRPAPTPPVSWCTIPNCQCSLSVPRSYLLSELYDYSSLNPYWSSWYLKAAQDPLYKGLALPPPPQPPLERAPLPPDTSEHRHEHRTLDHRVHEHRELHIDNRSSPGKELPTKMNMHERVKNWLDVMKPPKYETEHRTIRQTTAETRLSLRSSPTPEHYRNGDSASEAYSIHHPHFLSGHPSLRSPPPHPPPRYPHPPPAVEPHSPNEGPLNLTINNNTSSNNGNHSPTQSRPSVITCTTLTDRRCETNSNGSNSPSRRESSTEFSDPAIEEHFRRSLGKNYPEYLRHHSATPSPPPPPVVSQAMPSPHSLPAAPPRMLSPETSVAPTAPVTGKNVSITGSVDDHFARALGNSTWSALKAKNDPADAAPAPNSVDDHFAKALGDTWLRLKDKKDQPKGSHPFPLSHPIPHPLPHPIPRAHSLPHPLPQRPSSPSSQSHSGPLLST